MQQGTHARIFVCMVGIIVGIILIFVGLDVRRPETYSIGEYIQFGADFYTEIYDVTQDVGGAVNIATKNICNAIGLLIVAIGAFDICYFLRKTFDIENYANPTQAHESDNKANTATTSASSASNPAVKTSNVLQTESVARPAHPVAPVDGKWTCSCGRVNANYVSTCCCGKNKHEQ